jgi:hypothetical protein
MKKAKQWEKPEVGVLSFTQPSINASSSRIRRAQYHLGPTPPSSVMDQLLYDTQYNLGVGPTPPIKDVIW